MAGTNAAGSGSPQSGGGAQGAAANAAGSAAAGGGPKTRAEQIAILDGKLNRDLGQFDGMVQDQRARAEKQDRNGGGAGAAGSGDQTDSGGAAFGYGAGDDTAPPLTGARPGAGGGGSGGGGGLPTMPASRHQGQYAPVATAATVPDDIPSGDSDDVVARQLREAAMKETDPELRKKLWNEYRKYKGLPLK